ncbi:hypothetical protein IWX49DRAFT_631027 [Phyllosticta citricarpa]|uniref:Uncharacterized protein n=1 Tax=Phyllosticta citricarpa TaxID=55181 RepID=A0ABR1MAJ0_9PEZI
MAQEYRQNESSASFDVNLDDLLSDWPADFNFPTFDTTFDTQVHAQTVTSNDLVSLPSGDYSGQYNPQSENHLYLQTTLDAHGYTELSNSQDFFQSLAAANPSNDLFALPSDDPQQQNWQAQAAVPYTNQYIASNPSTVEESGPGNILDPTLTFLTDEPNFQTHQTTTLTAPAANGSANVSLVTASPSRTQANQSRQTRPRLDSPEFAAPINTAEYGLEKPEHDLKHSWVRINKTTMGLTKRSGKINTYDPEKMYESLPHPQGPWQSKSFQFMYSPQGELSMPTYSVEQIKQFIYDHPVSADCKLRLWIQKCAADSARRYPTSTLNRCRFANCPIRHVLGNDGTMIAGHYRVCVDEKSFKYGQRVDPYKMTAYFHLYCFEKFMDLPDICRLNNVVVMADQRQFQSEPKSKFNASLAGERSGAIAERFIDSCRRQRIDAATGARLVKFLDDYQPYPQHRGDGWYHGTLSYHMIRDKEANRATSSKHALAARAQKFSQIQHNLGDLDLFAQAKLAERKPARQPVQRKRKKLNDDRFDSEDESDDDVAERRRTRRRKVSTSSSAYAAPAALPGTAPAVTNVAVASPPLMTAQPQQQQQQQQQQQAVSSAPIYPSEMDFFGQSTAYTPPTPPPQQHQQQSIPTTASSNNNNNSALYPPFFDDSDSDAGLFVE